MFSLLSPSRGNKYFFISFSVLLYRKSKGSYSQLFQTTIKDQQKHSEEILREKQLHSIDSNLFSTIFYLYSSFSLIHSVLSWIILDYLFNKQLHNHNPETVKRQKRREKSKQKRNIKPYKLPKQVLQSITSWNSLLTLLNQYVLDKISSNFKPLGFQT